MSDRDTLWLLRDAFSRVTRADEALTDGEHSFAKETLGDLAGDLWAVIERLEGEDAA